MELVQYCNVIHKLFKQRFGLDPFDRRKFYKERSTLVLILDLTLEGVYLWRVKAVEATLYSFK